MKLCSESIFFSASIDEREDRGGRNALRLRLTARQATMRPARPGAPEVPLKATNATIVSFFMLVIRVGKKDECRCRQALAANASSELRRLNRRL